MILVDTNLLVYTVNRDAPEYSRAVSWFDETLSRNVAVGLPWIAVIGFLRITTNHRVMPKPLQVEEALLCVDRWLQQSCVSLLGPGEKHWSILSRLLQASGTAGNLTNDAHIAAIAIEHGYTVYSADNDFRRFSGLSHVNPLESREVHETAAAYRRRGKRAR